MAGAGSTTRTSTKRRSASTCASRVDIIRSMTGAAPLGWYTGPRQPEHAPTGRRARRLSVRRRLLRRRSAVLDAGRDERRARVPHLIVPYTLDCNDMRFATPQGFNTGEHFLTYLRDTFDVLYAEGEDRAEDDVHRPALPSARPARPLRCAPALSRPRRAARPGLGVPPGGHRAALGRTAPCANACDMNGMRPVQCNPAGGARCPR